LAADTLARLTAALRDRFAIERELGHGGMATVYLARDLKHDRLVAIKVLRADVAAALGADRFLREVQIVAKLSHPHILQLHDSGEAAGFLFFVMPYVEGETLRQRLDKDGSLPVDTATRLAAEVASALAYAHEHGIVHRDIKPENILLDAGQAIVSDFGIARAIDAAGQAGTGTTALTSTGLAIGTPTYMSPEQAHCEAVDGRCDVYSLGCVLYEMLAGSPPFTGPTAQAVLARHTSDPVPSLRKARADVPAALELIVATALAKLPEDRFATAATFRDALTGAAPPPRRRVRWQRRAVMMSTLVAAIGAVLVAGYAFRARRLAGPSAALVPSVAVLAFQNIGGDSANEPFSDGMSDEITTALGRVKGLHVAARSSAFGYKGKDIVPREIGRRLQVRYVLDGGVRVRGDRRRVSVQLIDVADGTEVWSEDYDRDARDPDVFAVQDSIARAIVASLRVHLSAPARAALTSRSTENPEAHDLYLKGRFFWNQRGTAGQAALQRAIGFLEQAIAIDSSYARAWAGLADAYSMLPGFGTAPPAAAFPKAKAAAQRAVSLDSTLADAHTSLGIVSVFYDWDWERAGREFDRALAIDSTEARTHQFRAIYFTAMGRVDSALVEWRTAQRLDPLSPIVNARVGTSLSQSRRFAEAEVAYRQALALDSTNVNARAELGMLFAIQRRLPEAFAMFRMIDSVDFDRQAGYLVAGPEGYAYGVAGRRTEALAIQRRLEQLSRSHYISPLAFAFVAIGLGDTTRALDWLERAYRERTFLVPMLINPIYDPLRSQPRFQQIVRNMGVVIPPALVLPRR
jgi:eukaryotic-like serine/threonine-protein kinase